jgi:hypothetical protein
MQLKEILILRVFLSFHCVLKIDKMKKLIDLSLIFFFAFNINQVILVC